MKKVLVTGGCGFIGSHIVDELLSRKFRVIVVDNLTTGNFNNIFDKEVVFFKCDINSEEFQNIVDEQKPQYIIHQAAQVSVSESIKNMMYDMELNVKGSLNVIEAARRNNVEKIIFASSAAVYGEPKYVPIDITHTTEPVSPYGLSKLTVEKYFKIANDLYGIDYTILRYSNVYGPRQNTKGEGGVVAVFADKLVIGQNPIIFGDGEQTRDFIFVKDVAKANVAALTGGSREILNISSSTRTSVNQLFKLMCEVIDQSFSPIYKSERLGDIKHSQLLNEQTKDILGVQLDYDLKQGLKETFDYYAANKQSVLS
ncbi:NAD-dependent epimerase/dehydratase family protein [Bacillus cereus]